VHDRTEFQALSLRLALAPTLPVCSAVKMRPSLVCALAVVTIPLLSACGDSNASTPSGGSSGGSSSSGSSSGGSSSGATGSGGSSSGGRGNSSGGATSSSGGGTRDAGPGGSGSGGGGGSTSSGGSSGSSPDAGDDSAGGNGGPDGAGDGAGIVVPDTKVVMYLPNWGGSYSSWATKVDFNKMTHMLLAFGLVKGTNGWDLGAQDADVQALTAAAHAKGVKVLVSIGGEGGDSSIMKAYGDATNIAPLVANLDSMVSRMNLDGVDVDLEQGKQMSSSTNYPAFVSKLMSTFHPEGKLVTSALAQYIVQDANPDATIIGVVNSFDFINDMIYTTNLNDYTSESDWWTSTVNLPKNKLVWGVNFEGNSLSVNTVKQIATSSKAYGGIMAWEYTQSSEAQLWPAIQSIF
jgi:hypothetical protein